MLRERVSSTSDVVLKVLGVRELVWEDGDILPEVLEADGILPLATADLAFRMLGLEANRSPPFAPGRGCQVPSSDSGLGLSVCYLTTP